MTTPPDRRPRDVPAARAFRAHIKGGGFLTRHVSQKAGSYVAAAAFRRGWSPDRLSCLNLVLSLVTGVAVCLLWPGHGPTAGVVAFVGWQLAFACDCADGQLARMTSSSRPLGALIDSLCDFGAHVALAAALGGRVLSEVEGTWSDTLVVTAAATLTLGSYMSGLASGLFPRADRSPRSSPVSRVGQVVQDYPLHLAAASVALAVGGAFATAVLFLMACSHVAATWRLYDRLRKAGLQP